ncbi:MAG: hypothetical protein WKF37_15485 [Bryobacteraceae bacterium]
MRFGDDMFESFVKYQNRLCRALDSMAVSYEFELVDANRSVEEIYLDLQARITNLLAGAAIQPAVEAPVIERSQPAAKKAARSTNRK